MSILQPTLLFPDDILQSPPQTLDNDNTTTSPSTSRSTVIQTLISTMQDFTLLLSTSPNEIPKELIITASSLLHRYYVTNPISTKSFYVPIPTFDGDQRIQRFNATTSTIQNNESTSNLYLLAMSCLFLSAKVIEFPLKIRDLILLFQRVVQRRVIANTNTATSTTSSSSPLKIKIA